MPSIHHSRQFKHRRLLAAVYPTDHHFRSVSLIVLRSNPHIWALTPLDSMCSSSSLVDSPVAYCHDLTVAHTIRYHIDRHRDPNDVGDPLQPHHQCRAYRCLSFLSPATIAAAAAATATAAVHDSCPRDRPRRSNRIQNGDRAIPWPPHRSPELVLVHSRYRRF